MNHIFSYELIDTRDRDALPGAELVIVFAPRDDDGTPLVEVRDIQRVYVQVNFGNGDHFTLNVVCRHWSKLLAACHDELIAACQRGETRPTPEQLGFR